MGRVRVRVPMVYGPVSGAFGNIPDGNLPWALPAGIPAGGTPNSGGFSWIPSPGDRVWVRFLDGEPEKPVWEWGTQDLDQQKSFVLHQYDNKGAPKKRGALTRYGHTIEFNPLSLILASKNGYSFVIQDSNTGQYDGALRISTATGSFVEIGDDPVGGASWIEFVGNHTAYVNSDYEVNATHFHFIASDMPIVGQVGAWSGAGEPPSTSPSLTGLTREDVSSLPSFRPQYQISADKIVFGKLLKTAGGSEVIDALKLGTETADPGAAQRAISSVLDPVVRLSDMEKYTLSLTQWIDGLLSLTLQTYFEQLQVIYSSHIHPTDFGPTGPPAAPLPVWTLTPPLAEAFETGMVPTGSPILFTVRDKPGS